MSCSLRPHGLQCTRLPCPPLSPRVCPHLCQLSQRCHPTISFSVSPLSSCPQSFQAWGSFPEALRISWTKGYSFSFRISPSNEYSGLISLRMDWFDNLVVQGTLKSPLQHHSLKASVLQCSAFFMVHLSHPYMPTGKKHSFHSFSCIWLFATPRTVACQSPLSMEHSRPEFSSG